MCNSSTLFLPERDVGELVSLCVSFTQPFLVVDITHIHIYAEVACHYVITDILRVFATSDVGGKRHRCLSF